MIAQAARTREAELMLFGYNQALLEISAWPEGHSRESWAAVIDGQRARLGK